MVMRSSPVFCTGGALRPDHPSYTGRAADCEAMQQLTNDKLIYMIAPRQMGKTSLLFRLSAALKDLGWHCCYLDLATMSGCPEPQWCKTFAEAVTDECRLDTDSYPDDTGRLWQFLRQDVRLEERKDLKLALLLDEVEGLLGLPFSDSFLMGVRELYQRRFELAGQIRFALAGCVSPARLVHDRNFSPFNVAEQIRLDEFTQEESRALTSRLAETGLEIDPLVHGRVHSWASGHPYLTQRICELVERTAPRRGRVTEQTVDQLVHDHMILVSGHDSNVDHVGRAVAALQAQPANLWRRLRAGQAVHSSAIGFDALYLTGAVKETSDGNVLIRNLIYEAALPQPSLVGTSTVPWHSPLDALGKVLADLYPTDADWRRLVASAGMAASRISATGSMLNTWHATLQEARELGQLGALMDLALSEYPQNDRLKDACDACYAWLSS